ncbi:MAG: AAA family ATPase [Pirellula sp.]|nr:AAA family ATPase [Pirellula sp.]
MQLKTIRITNFKCVRDSGQFNLDAHITCLVGKNESGKTAILQAIEKINPLKPKKPIFDALEYPRSMLTEFQESEVEKHGLETTWELSDDDVASVESIVGEKVLKSRSVTIKRGYYDSTYWTIQIDEGKAFANLLESSELFEEERAAIQKSGSAKAAIELLTTKSKPDEQGGTAISEREQAVLSKLQALGKEQTFWQSVVDILNCRVPKVVYFSEYMRMPGQVSLSDLESRPNAKEEPGNQVFLALLGMIGQDLASLKSLTTFEHLQGQLEAASNKITRDIFRYWSQNRSLRVQFRFEQGLPGDTPPFNSGYVMRTRIENTRHGVTTSFDERSSGFVWFFSFLVWFSQIKKTYGESLIILLDEPGLALHAKAQSDLLRYFEEQLAPKYQVVYSTHSPFMVDPSNLLRVRTVEDVYNEGKASFDDSNDLGTKVGDDVLSTDRDTLFPLQASLGYEITQTLFVGEHTLLVEGPSEVLYLPWFSRKLEAMNRTGLDRRWVITPCGGIDKIPAFLSLFGGQKLHIATLVDFASGQKGQIDRIRRNKLLQDGHVFTADAICGQSEADVEDIIGRRSYIAIVNECYGLKAKQSLPAKKPANAPVRVVKEVEEHFRTIAITGDEFDHFRPSEFLTQKGTAYTPEGLDSALERFEKLFQDLNSLLPK